MTDHCYIAFGLRVRSSWPIPALAESEAPFDGPPDVDIVAASVPVPATVQDVDGLKVNVNGKAAFLDIEECGRFEIVEGRTIRVEPESGATTEQVNLYLLGSVFGMLLHQRKLIPFHCNAVEIDGSALLFCGDSGAGKSTLAAHFIERGFRLLGDDLCALSFGPGGQVLATPGAARLKLWQDTLEEFGRSRAGLKLLPWYEDKFEVPLSVTGWAQSVPVAGIYHLRIAENGRPPGIHALKGLESANAVTANIYRRRLADLSGATQFYLAATARIVETVPTFTINRNWGFAHFYNQVRQLEEHMHGIVEEHARIGGKRVEST